MSALPTSRRSGRPSSGHAASRGAATLVVVMVLFFIVALVAAYASRNLIFEQRTSANQYRATQAFEAAEAGLEWALTQLNSGRIDARCAPRVDPATADESFRLRYLSMAFDGAVTARLRPDGSPRRAACVFDGANWQCNCPGDAAPALASPVGAGPFPAFVLRFHDVDSNGIAYPPGVTRIESTGCTRLDADSICTPGAASGDGRATTTILAALKGALVTPPAAASTVRGNLTRAPNAVLRAVNQDPTTHWLTVHAGAIVAPDETWLIALGAPGTPWGQSFVEDASMLALQPDPMFVSVFGMARSTYRLQPASMQVRCAQDCSAARVRDLALLNPGRVLWIDGDFDFSIGDAIGSAAFPVALVVNGSVTVSHANARLNGLLYTTGPTLTNIGTLTLAGALVGEANLALDGNGTSNVVYDAAMLNLLRRGSGSFVRVPGSWRDF